MSYYGITIDNPNLPVVTPELENLAYGKVVDPYEGLSPRYEKYVMDVKARDMYLPNFTFRLSEGQFSHDAVLFNETGQGKNMLGSCFLMKGTITSSSSRSSEKTLLPGHYQNFKYDPHNIMRHMIKANDPFQLAHFSYTEEYLNQILPGDEKWADLLRTRILKKELILGNQSKAITLIQERALQNIFSCPISGKFGMMLIETSIVQLLLLHFHALFNETEQLPQGVTRRDADLIQSLREHLKQNFLDDHCLDNLSKQVGMNVNKLMMVFRKVYGKSIFEYITDLRMEFAKGQLLEKDTQVTEIARTLGYRNPNHFSTAFKKRFGVSPTAMR